jgi:putative hydrolase of the HAD superfamily
VVLVTNAHRDSLSLKMQKTALQFYFDDIISSHDVGLPKEHQGFWQALHATQVFENHNTVLIDDSLAVLHCARQFGIVHLVSISRPDSQLPNRLIIGYPAIEDFRALMDGL